MTKHDDGGPAFPNTYDEWHEGLGGMSLLDYYAGQVISPMLVQAYGKTPDVLADYAYNIAQAMIAEKRRLEGKELSAHEQLQDCITDALDLARDYDGQAQPDEGNYNGPGLCKLIDEIVMCLRSGKPIPAEAAADESDKGEG